MPLSVLPLHQPLYAVISRRFAWRVLNFSSVLVFHGALGQALARIGTNFRDYFYKPSPPAHWSGAQQAPPRPYILIPPLDEKARYAAGDTLSLGIILYGSAIDYFLIVFAALEHLGEFMGLGKQRGRLR